MPKLNVQQNNQNVIQSLANGVAIGQLNGIIKCDGANNFSVAEAGGGGGRNLLDNPWFTVNQRGFTSGTSGYISDRWTILGGNPTITALSPYGISVATSSAYNFIQNCWFTEADIDGRTLTLSANIDGEIQSVTFTAAVNSYYSFNFNNGLDMFRIYTGSSATAHPQVRFTHNTGSATHNYTVYATKLELGSVSTLANDVPPEYDTALWHCQRARWQNTGSYIMTASAVSATQTIAVMPLPNVLFKTPTLEQQGAFVLADRVNAGIAVTTIQLLSSDLQTCALLITTGGGLTRGVTYGLALNGTGRLALNADL